MNKVIFPILIIIFSLLIIYAIFNLKNNNKINKFVESFDNKINESIKLDILNNSNTFKQIGNGSWTTNETKVDNEYKPTLLMNINITGDYNNINNKNYGTINYANNANFTIIHMVNNNLIAELNNNNFISLHIKFVNKENPNADLDVNKPYYLANTQMAIVSIFANNFLLTKYISYKIYNNNVGAEVYRILKAQSFLMDPLPEIYDLNTYNILIDKYKYNDNYLSLDSGYSNNEIMNKIISKYGPTIQFSIQRVFQSPTGEEIRTNASKPILLNIIKNGTLPYNFIIESFKKDKEANNLQNFFRPKYTILYFYKLINEQVEYGYSQPKNNIDISLFNIRNNANNLYNNYVSTDNIKSVEKIFNSTYQMTYLGLASPSTDGNFQDQLMDATTIIPFSQIFDKL